MGSENKGVDQLRFICPSDLMHPFYLQENSNGDEIYNSLKYVRPGNAFEPAFQLMEKVQVNGSQAHPLFSYLRDQLPFPSDDDRTFMKDPKSIIWEPVTRTDISWNFEKFLITPEGQPYKRYGRYFETIKIKPDIEELIKNFNVT